MTTNINMHTTTAKYYESSNIFIVGKYGSQKKTEAKKERIANQI